MARRKKRRKHGKRKSILRVFFGTLAVCLLLVMLGGVGWLCHIVYTAKPIDTSNIYSKLEQTSYVYGNDEELLGELFYEEDREIVSSADMPSNLKNAVIAIEDKTFYSHHGFNFKRMFGAVINKLLGKSSSISGTSTITQQLARNVFLSDIKSERTIERKVTEMYYAWQIERDLSKEEILEAYLNTIYLGYGCYGVDSAAKTYFSKEVKDLSLPECAALAALPQAPDEYALLKDEDGDGVTPIEGTDVYANDASKERRFVVLDLMAEQNLISEPEAESAKVDIASIINPHFEKPKSAYTYFLDYVTSQVSKDLASERGITKEEADRLVYTGGLKIYTTLDTDAQKAINKAFSDDSNFPYASEEPQASMVITEVGTGKVIAMSGGRGGKGQKLFNRATSPRQPGSSIKPLAVYAAALQKSFDCAKAGEPFPFEDYGVDKQGANGWGRYLTASSRVTDEKMIVRGEVWPKNATNTYSGYRTFRSALQQSINTCAVKILLQVGTDYSIGMLKKFGITTLQDDDAQPVNDINSASLALGAMTYGVTPLEMASAYETFPAGGVRHGPICYTKILDSEGNTVLEKETSSVRVMDEGVAWIMTDVLKSTVSNGIASDASMYGTQVGGKTGTTNDNYDIWFCGFTPKYSAALWIGTDHNVEMNALSKWAAGLWSDIMQDVPDSTDGEYKAQPNNVIYYGGEYFTKGTEVGADFSRSKRKSSSSNSSSSSSGSSSGGTSNSGGSSSGSGRREDFVRDFTGETSGSSSSGSSGSSGSSRSQSSGSDSSSRDEWLKDWQNSN